MVRRAGSYVHGAVWLIIVGLIIAITLVLLIAGVHHAAKYAAVLGAVAATVSTGMTFSSFRRPDGSAPGPSSTTNPSVISTSTLVWAFAVVAALSLTVTAVVLA